MAVDPKIDAQIRRAIADFYDDPLGYVMFNFPWTSDPSIQMVKLPSQYADRFESKFGPGAWACDFLDELGREIRKRAFDGSTPCDPIRFSTASGHGIGKSVMAAFLTKFIHDTRPFSRMTVTAVTDIQLRGKTWAELAKWHNRSLTRHWSDLATGRGNMSLRNRMYPQEWYAVAQTSREENSESFAGQHAANSSSVYLFDEASGVPDKIFEVREGGLTDGEPMVFDFGNPTRNSGAFFENTSPEGSKAHRYIVRNIDMRDVEITNKKWAQEKVDDYGEDHDIVRVRVRGQFPRQSSLQFISGDAVRQSMARPLVLDRNAPLIIGVDVAREGDDETVIFTRVGMDARSWLPRRYSKLDNVQVAQKVMETVREFERMGLRTSALFVDIGGVGGGVYDILKHAGFAPTGVNFGSSPLDPKMYRLRVDEIWGRMRDAINDRLCLPDEAGMKSTGEPGATLQNQLTNREYGHTLKEQISLEKKSDLKRRGLGSPDVADALALTFAQDVQPINMPGAIPSTMGTGGSQVLHDYDPHAGA